VNVLAFDTETALMRPGVMAPELVCVSYQRPGHEPGLVHHSDAGALELVEVSLRDPRVLLVGHHVAYDFSVLCAKWPHLVPLVFAAYDADRIACTKIRQQLLDIAAGEFRGRRQVFEKGVEVEITADDEDAEGEVGDIIKKLVRGVRWIPHNYDLADLIWRAAGRRLEKDEWRLRYVEFINTPITQWPEGAVKYSKEDARATLDVFLSQEQHVEFIPDQFRQARAAWALHLTSVWGIRTRGEGVDALERATIAALAGVKETLQDAGLVRRGGKKDGSRDTKAAKARMVQVCTEKGLEVRMTAPSKRFPHGSVSLDSDACEASGDSLLEDYAEITFLQGTLNRDVEMLRAGTEHPVHTSFGMAASGRSTSAKPNVQNPKRRNEVYRDGVLKYALPDVRECFIPRPGKVFAQADFSGLELHTLAQVCVSLFGHSELADVLNAGLDPHTDFACQILGITYEEGMQRKKSGDKEFDNARQTGKVCFHPDTEVLTKEGWKALKHLTGEEEIATPVLADDRLEAGMYWRKPLRLTRRKSPGTLLHLQNESTDVRVTQDHNMAGWMLAGPRQGPKRLEERSREARFADRYRYLPHAGKMLDGVSGVPRRFARMLAATQADGTYSHKKIRFGFTKLRKIRRFRWLFEGFYTESVSSQGATTFVVGGELAAEIMRVMPQKYLVQEMLQWDYETRRALVNETRYWDSHRYKNKSAKKHDGNELGWSYCSVPEQNRRVLSALAASVGYKSTERGLILSIKPRCFSHGGNLRIEEEKYDGDVLCLTTETGFVLVRYGGKTLITRQCNFGYPGGLGAESLCFFARKSYNVYLTEDEAKALKQRWLERWPEMRKFFQHCASLVDDNDGLGLMQQLFSNRWRGGCHYTALCNSWFQGLGADAAKRALYLVQRACYAEPDSVLYDSRPVNFVHDEVILEVDDDDRAHDKAVELGRLMVVGGTEFLPDVPPRIEPLLSRCWSKKSKAVHDSRGRLVAWSTEMEEIASVVKSVAKKVGMGSKMRYVRGSSASSDALGLRAEGDVLVGDFVGVKYGYPVTIVFDGVEFGAAGNRAALEAVFR
jgi:DNA polymerase I